MWVRFGESLAYGNCFEKFGPKMGYRCCDSPQGRIIGLQPVPYINDVWIACFDITDEDEPEAPCFYCALLIYDHTHRKRFHCWIHGGNSEPSWTVDKNLTVTFVRGDGSTTIVHLQDKLKTAADLGPHIQNVFADKNVI